MLIVITAQSQRKRKIDSDQELQQTIKPALQWKNIGVLKFLIFLLLGSLATGEVFSFRTTRSWIRQFHENPQKSLTYIEPNRIKGMVTPAFGSWHLKLYVQIRSGEIDTLNVDLVLHINIAFTKPEKLSIYSLVELH